jgi:hypothetical protein
MSVASSSAAASTTIELDRVFGVGGGARGLSLRCSPGLTFVIDSGNRAENARTTAEAFAGLVAGTFAPTSGRVRVLGADPRASAATRRSVAILGAPILLESAGTDRELRRLAFELADARGVDARFVSAALVRHVAEPASRPSATALIDVADALAGADGASVVVAFVNDGSPRKQLDSRVRSALSRGATVVVVVDRIDPWLHLADRADTIAWVVDGGVALGSVLAHQAPWSRASDEAPLRSVRVRFAEARADRSILQRAADAIGAVEVASIDRIDAQTVRISTVDPRAIARAFTAAAKAGVALDELVVEGARASDVGAQLRGGHR